MYINSVKTVTSGRCDKIYCGLVRKKSQYDGKIKRYKRDRFDSRRKDRAQGAQAVDSVRCGGCGYGFGDSPVVAYTADAKIKR